MSAQFRQNAFLLACVLTALAPFLYNLSYSRSVGQTDLVPVITAAHLFNAGEYAAIYDHAPYENTTPEAWIAVEKTLPNGTWQTVYPYTPAYLLPFALLVRLFEYMTVVQIVFLLNLAIVGAGAVLAARRLSDRPLVQGLVIWFICSSTAAGAPVKLGQNFLICAAALYGFTTAYLNDRRGRAVLWFLIAAAAKPWAAAFLMLPFLRRDYKSTALFAGTLCAFVGAQYLWNPELFHGYIHITRSHTALSILAANNHSLSAGLTRLLTPGWPAFNTYANAGAEMLATKLIRYALILPVIAAGWIARHDRIRVQATVTVIFLLGNVFWDFYGLLLMPFFLLTALETRHRGAAVLWWLLGFATLWIWHAHIYEAAARHLVYRMELRSVEIIVALYSLLPAALYLGMFVEQCRRNDVFSRGWLQRLFVLRD